MSVDDRHTGRLELRPLRSFAMPDGTRRELRDPDGPPTARQLLALWHEGALTVVRPDAKNEFTRAEAAYAISWLKGDS